METVAVIGAAGAVGQEIIKLLEERRFPLKNLRCFGSSRSAGSSISFRGEKLPIERLDSLEGIDLAFFCAGSSVSKEWKNKAPCLVVDSSSAFRMEKEIPLVIPEINAHAIHGNWIASPNCTATVLLMPLYSLHRRFHVKRIVTSTYQAASGGGRRLLKQLEDETKAHVNGHFCEQIFPFPYAFNVYPHNSHLDASGYVEEEIKMRDETRKILEDPSIQMSATCVRVPVLRAHSVSANVEFHKPFTMEEIETCLEGVPGIHRFEERSENRFATPADASGKDEILYGRLRIDTSQPNTLEFWAVGDQLRKGAALNAVQIGEALLRCSIKILY